jgi:nucleotide sugar dehydrogenase
VTAVHDTAVLDADVIDLRVPSPSPQPGSRWWTADGVTVIGLGYVGLNTALSFLERGCRVVGCDVSARRLELLRRADPALGEDEHVRVAPFVDPDGDARHLLALVESVDDAPSTRAVLICVPTPVDAHLVPDLGPLRAACADAVERAVPGQVIVLTSTTYVGTTRDLLVEPLEARGLRVGTDVFVAFSPERVDPGNTTFRADRVPRVVGGVTPACRTVAREFLAEVTPLVHEVSSPEAAELTKLFENTFRAVNIALANELADVARGLDIHPIEVVEAAATKPFGFMPFLPGPGVGGHCIPVDPHYLLWQLRAERRSAPLIEQAMSSIAARPARVVDRAMELLASRGRSMVGADVLVVGVTYKPDVADLRESPALEIIELLAARGARVRFHDPMIEELRDRRGTPLERVDGAITSHDLVIVHTVHRAADHRWLAHHDLVLDATYRCEDAPHAAVV